MKLYLSTASQRIFNMLVATDVQSVLLTGRSGIGLSYIAAVAAKSSGNRSVVIEPDEKGTIGIDTIRDLYKRARTGGFIWFIINHAEALTVQAQNAFLKLLEEPVPTVSFVLCGSEPDRLLPTIRSRVQEYTITPISSAQSNQLLDELKITDPTKRAQLLFIAQGLPASLITHATTPKLFAERSELIRDARSFIQGSREDRLLIGARFKDRVMAAALIIDMQKLLRRNIESEPKPGSTDPLDLLMGAHAALSENASVRLTLTQLALLL